MCEGLGCYFLLDSGLLSAIHFQNSSPRFISIQECVVTFLWETEAACPIKETKDDSQVRKSKQVCSWSHRIAGVGRDLKKSSTTTLL